ncbi:nuclear transport factor 2 family protein [Porticoccus sp. GXU_MW_L64]
MNNLDRLAELETRLALTELNNAFTHYLDNNLVDQFGSLFTEDALYTHGTRRSEGREAIVEQIRKRTAAGPRTARHMATGLQLTLESSTSARGHSVCMTFARDGEPPIDGAEPFLVADFDDVYRWEDGRWLIQERHITRIFVGAGNTGPIGQNK